MVTITLDPLSEEYPEFKDFHKAYINPHILEVGGEEDVYKRQIYNDPASDFEIERKADNSTLTIEDSKAHEAIVAILNDTPFPEMCIRDRACSFFVPVLHCF